MSTKRTVTAWVTKYALTSGVIKVTGEVTDDMPQMIVYKHGAGGFDQYAHRKDWYTDRGAAVTRTEEMRTSKIKSMRKQIEKLESTEISIPE